MIILLPLTIYYLAKNGKNNKVSFDIVLFIVLFAFVGGLFCGKLCEQVSQYYLMKNYYALWIVLMYFNGRSLLYIAEKGKILPSIILGSYILMIVVSLVFRDKELRNIGLAKDENFLDVCDIFVANKTIITKRKTGYKPDEIEILKYAKNNIDFSKEDLEIICDPMQMYWSYDLLHYMNYEEWLDVYNVTHNPTEFKFNAKYLTSYQKAGKVDYIVYFKKCEMYGLKKDVIFEGGEIIFENEAGGIIKYDK